MRMPTHPLPINAGKTSEDTKALARSLCPRRPIFRFAYRPALSHGGSLWMRFRLYFRLIGL